MGREEERSCCGSFLQLPSLTSVSISIPLSLPLSLSNPVILRPGRLHRPRLRRRLINPSLPSSTFVLLRTSRRGIYLNGGSPIRLPLRLLQ
ncbi:hypothetical protein CRG98_024020, partial [Punica granatum]